MWIASGLQLIVAVEPGNGDSMYLYVEIAAGQLMLGWLSTWDWNNYRMVWVVPSNTSLICIQPWRSLCTFCILGITTILSLLDLLSPSRSLNQSTTFHQYHMELLFKAIHNDFFSFSSSPISLIVAHLPTNPTPKVCSLWWKPGYLILVINIVPSASTSLGIASFPTLSDRVLVRPGSSP